MNPGTLPSTSNSEPLWGRPDLRSGRGRYVVVGLVVAVVLGAIATQAAIGSSRQSAYGDSVSSLQATWRQDIAAGVPAASLAPLQSELSSDAPGWWSMDWWLNGPQGQLDDLRTRTQQVWDESVANGRASANAVVGEAQQLVTSSSTAASTSFTAAVPQWSAQVAGATTPASLTQLAAGYRAALADARTAVRAEQARAAAQAASIALTAQRATAGGDDARIAADMKPLEWDVEQSVVEGTPSSASFSAQLGALEQAYQAAQTAPALDAVRSQQVALRSAVDAENSANTCGHAVPAGRVLVMSLAAQEMVAYQDGCAVRATPVTTGRPQLPTPTGDFHVFYRTTPFKMVSPWPKGSPFWYPTTQVRWVLEFAAGGYFIHDADWEALDDYGPGGQNNLHAASHGCVHVPTDTMRWLYGWAQNGTEVVIQP